MDKDIKNKEVRKKLFIKVYYSLLDWEWYDDANTFRVFMHLLLIANRKDNKIHGRTIHRGEALASVDFLAKELKLSTKNVRTALKHLKETNEVAIRKIANISVIRLNNYEKYQSGGKPNGNSMANEWQMSGKSVATPIYCKNDKNEILQYNSTRKKENKPSFDIELALQRSLNLDPTKIRNA